ncbi:MAG: AcrR family transcriptional regulator [Oleispira sp.]
MIIIVAAKKLFHEEGVDAVSMRRIAAEVGMGAMTLYKYFNNKRDILHFIWDEFFTELLNKLNDIVNSELTDKELFKQLHHTYLHYWVNNPNNFRMVFLNEDSGDNQDNYFVDRSSIENKMLEIFLPAISQTLKGLEEEEMKLIMQSLLCFMNGIALNLITISEYNWPSHFDLLELHLNLILDKYN